jgi:hypothetical protein
MVRLEKHRETQEPPKCQCQTARKVLAMKSCSPPLAGEAQGRHPSGSTKPPPMHGLTSCTVCKAHRTGLMRHFMPFCTHLRPAGHACWTMVLVSQRLKRLASVSFPAFSLSGAGTTWTTGTGNSEKHPRKNGTATRGTPAASLS